MKGIVSAFCLLALASAASAQDQAKIDQAIHRGIEYLKTAGSPGHEHSKATHSDELILYTFIIADVPSSNPKFKSMLERVLTDEPHQTYKVALQAMALEELDRVKYQNRIAYCAQHLIDNECTNGQWSYGNPTLPPKDLPAAVASDGGDKPKPVTGARDFSAGAKPPKPKVLRKVAIKKQKDGGGSGDNSNTQYAALGLRACFDAGILIPEDSIQLAVKWLIESAHAAEGKGVGANAVGTGPGETPGVPQGWGYKGAGDGEPYGSMTAGATGALTIYDYMLKKDWKKDPIAKNGVAWLTSHYDIDSNPGKGGQWLYYYLYGLERVGVLYDVKLLGNHDWYQEGAKFLLEKQGANGAWNAEWDTCFAILFLKKATKPLVVSSDARRSGN